MLKYSFMLKGQWNHTGPAADHVVCYSTVVPLLENIYCTLLAVSINPLICLSDESYMYRPRSSLMWPLLSGRRGGHSIEGPLYPSGTFSTVLYCSKQLQREVRCYRAVKWTWKCYPAGVHAPSLSQQNHLSLFSRSYHSLWCLPLVETAQGGRFIGLFSRVAFPFNCPLPLTGWQLLFIPNNIHVEIIKR